MPLHPVALEILTETGPMAVSSANATGHPPAATAADAQAQLGYQVGIYLEAGEGGAQVPSTIVDVTRDVPRVLRLGAVELDELRKVVPELEA
jgi:L-threonylcarbamoyladenylate synthase